MVRETAHIPALVRLYYISQTSLRFYQGVLTRVDRVMNYSSTQDYSSLIEYSSIGFMKDAHGPSLIEW